MPAGEGKAGSGVAVPCRATLPCLSPRTPTHWRGALAAGAWLRVRDCHMRWVQGAQRVRCACCPAAPVTRVAAREGDGVGHRVLRQVVPDLGPLARGDLQEALGDPRGVEAVHHVEAGHGTLGGGLEHHRVAGDEGGTDLGHREVDGVVEGRDAEDHAEGHALYQGQLRAWGRAGGEVRCACGRAFRIQSTGLNNPLKTLGTHRLQGKASAAVSRDSPGGTRTLLRAWPVKASDVRSLPSESLRMPSSAQKSRRSAERRTSALESCGR